MTKFIWEILEEINKDTSKASNYRSFGALKIVLENNFNPSLKWLLPETTPPFRSSVEPSGMSPSNLHMEAKKFYIFRRADLKAPKREVLFIEMLERVGKEEANILLAIKNQTLTSLYPNITKEVAKTIVPSIT